MRIDSHQHFWKYDSAQYDWIPTGSTIHRDFGPEDLKPLLQAAQLDGCVAVQARQSLVENEYLCNLAAQHDFIRGVVGWIDLRSEMVDEQAAAFRALPKAVGVRHVVQGETDPEFMAREPFRRGISKLRMYGLVYDILIFEHQLADAIALVKAFPEQRFVIDHIAKPRIKEKSIRDWSEKMTEISHYSNTWVKLSGMVTEADHQSWKLSDLEPYWDATLQAFGADRILFGSDWPVIRLACSYERWIEIVSRWLERLPESDRGKIWGKNAVDAYQLKV
ncbi:MAG: amidohydrolase family protein [Pirellula sp.]|jgi:L-fuconolactonase|nr:amidohydrolase family protein [Pirellula sp.]